MWFVLSLSSFPLPFHFSFSPNGGKVSIVLQLFFVANSVRTFVQLTWYTATLFHINFILTFSHLMILFYVLRHYCSFFLAIFSLLPHSTQTRKSNLINLIRIAVNANNVCNSSTPSNEASVSIYYIIT